VGSSRNPNAGIFVVILDELQTEIDGYSATPDNGCSFTFSKTALAAGLHNLTISFLGPSPQAQSESSSSFELNGFQYVVFLDM
jgi:hypothetical protein